MIVLREVVVYGGAEDGKIFGGCFLSGIRQTGGVFECCAVHAEFACRFGHQFGEFGFAGAQGFR